MLRVFHVSGVASLIGLGVAFYYDRWEGVLIAVILSLLEICLSFENAIVNATVLKDMAPIWRERFLTWGIVIAVFGMRLIFPVMLVSAMTDLSPLMVVDFALERPLEYEKYLASAHGSISAFGGMFLLMVFLEFIFDHKRQTIWIGPVERPLSEMGKVKASEIIFALLILLLIQHFEVPEQRASILVSGLAGIVTYAIVHGLAKYINNRYNSSAATKVANTVAKGGAMSFIYLEFLDASFSFDGVIGAFAITKDIILIMLGLGIGAFFVRSLTILLVERQTLQKYIYLEHGAYYALGSLSVMMLLGIHYHIPEVVIATLGATIIGISLISSIKARHS